MFTGKEAKQFIELLEQESEEPQDISECRSITQLVKYFPNFLKNLLKKELNYDIENFSINLSDIVFPDWLPIGVKEETIKHIELIKKYENDKVLELMCDFYGKQILQIKKLLPIFCEESMKNIWLNLTVLLTMIFG